VKILITGSSGFVAKNLIFHLGEKKNNLIYRYSRNLGLKNLKKFTKDCDIVYHLASKIRSNKKKNFKKNNTELTENLCSFLKLNKNKCTIIYSSTSKINDNSIYAKTKKESEKILLNHARTNRSKIYILRLPNIFGKWSKPNHNSFLATICYNITRDLKLKKINKLGKVNLIYIDNVINILLEFQKKNILRKNIINIKPKIKITIPKLVNRIKDIWTKHKNGEVINSSNEFDKNLYSTIISYLPKNRFINTKEKHADKRGFFSELVKSKSSGQFNLFTILPGKSRGAHYHHSKHEKFFLISGKAIFIKKNLLSGETINFKLNEKKIVEVLSVPGWWHEVKNTSNKPAYFLLWSNEIFNAKKHDTYKIKL
jgi:UDP-2-acetamido-2,6-beta-L-arabino-hexul-4-ose reductase